MGRLLKAFIYISQFSKIKKKRVLSSKERRRACGPLLLLLRRHAMTILASAPAFRVQFSSTMYSSSPSLMWFSESYTIYSMWKLCLKKIIIHIIVMCLFTWKVWLYWFIPNQSHKNGFYWAASTSASSHERPLILEICCFWISAMWPKMMEWEFIDYTHNFS